MHCEVHKDDCQVILDPNNKSSLSFVSPSNHFNMIPNLKELPQFRNVELEWILQREETLKEMSPVGFSHYS